MATRALLAVLSASPPCIIRIKASTFSSSLSFQRRSAIARCFSSDTNPSVLQPPNVSRLAETARISLTPAEVYPFTNPLCFSILISHVVSSCFFSFRLRSVDLRFVKSLTGNESNSCLLCNLSKFLSLMRLGCEIGGKCRFGQLQQVDVNSVEPAIRAGNESDFVCKVHNFLLCFGGFASFCCFVLWS